MRGGGEDFGDGVREIEAMAVGFEAEGLDLGDAGEALFVQVVFEGQRISLVGGGLDADPY
jgi:hypothetical protein